MTARFALTILLLVLAVVAFLFGVVSGIVNAQPVNCDDYQRIVNHLEQKYRERTVAVGALSNGRLVQVMASPQGSFTLLIVGPDGIACLVLSGDGWQAVAKQGNPS